MKNNTMIPYNPKKDLETNYYNKTEVELLVAGGSGGSIDLSNYYKKLETYSKAQVDALITGGGADLSDYYTKAEVESLISAIPATDLSNYYNKTQVDSLIPDISTKQDTLVSATNIKTINGESILGSGDIVISGGGTVDLSEYYKKTETYSKIEVDTKIDDIPETDLSGYYNKTQVDNIIADIPPTDLSNYYDKTETYSKVEVDTKISDIPATDLSNYYNKSQVDTIALDKVDKVAGKQLSTEDYTTADKNKLTGLSNYTKPASESISYITGLQTALDSKVSKTGVEALHSTDALRISGTTLSLYKGDGTFESVVTQDTIYTLPKASTTVLGGIKVGTNLSIDANGVLSANDTNVSFSEISNKPTNLSGYGITDAYTKTEVDTMVGDIASALDTINGQVI